MNITKLLQSGESKTLEFKKDSSSLIPIIKTIIAFANTAGGILLLGVTDTKDIIGLTELEKIQDQIANAIAVMIAPQLLVNLFKVAYQNKELLIIHVEHGLGPYFIKSEGLERGTYIRLGATTRLATPEMIAEMERQVSHLYYDNQPCYDSHFDDLDQNALNYFFKKINKENSHSNLLSLGIVIKKGTQIIPTNGGIILFGKKNKRLHYFPNTSIGCARFQGVNKAIFIDKVELNCDLISAVNEILKFVQRNTRTKVSFQGMRREESPEYPPLVIRELIINAFVHANYEVLGSRFLVGIFEDRIDISSPGTLPIGMTVEQLKAGVSQIRNKVIARVFKEFGYIEQWGSCYERIYQACIAENCPEPKWEEFSSQLRVTVYPPSHDPNMIHKKDHVGIMSNLLPEQITLLLYANEPRTRTELMEKLQAKHRVKFAAKYIHPLIALDLLMLTIPDKPKSKMQRYVTTAKGLAFLQEQKKHV